MRVRGKITAVAVGAALASAGIPATAGAQKGLTVDPQSPAGVEYAVPLDQGRGHGGGGSGHSGGGNGTSANSGGGGSPALFGSGITPASKSGSSVRGRQHGNASSGRRAGADKRSAGSAGSAGSGSVSGAARSGSAPVTASAQYSTTGPIAGVTGAVLLLGGGFGMFLRMRARRSPGTKPPL